MSRMMSILRVISCILIVMMMVGCPPTGADFAQDKKECQDKLVGLSSCLGFISGEEKRPTSGCCLKLAESYNQSRRCLCLLVRDRNEPNLGFKVNATLALTLPYVCHIPANETECLDLLKLDPHSPEAQIFQQSANTTATAGNVDALLIVLQLSYRCMYVFTFHLSYLSGFTGFPCRRSRYY